MHQKPLWILWEHQFRASKFPNFKTFDKSFQIKSCWVSDLNAAFNWKSYIMSKKLYFICAKMNGNLPKLPRTELGNSALGFVINLRAFFKLCSFQRFSYFQRVFSLKNNNKNTVILFGYHRARYLRCWCGVRVLISRKCRPHKWERIWSWHWPDNFSILF